MYKYISISSKLSGNYSIKQLVMSLPLEAKESIWRLFPHETLVVHSGSSARGRVIM